MALSPKRYERHTGYTGFKIYLYGSLLTKGPDARDIDLIAIVHEHGTNSLEDYEDIALDTGKPLDVKICAPDTRDYDAWWDRGYRSLVTAMYGGRWTFLGERGDIRAWRDKPDLSHETSPDEVRRLARRYPV